MSELYDILTETPPTKVVLLALDQGLWDCERSLAELAALCEANHMEAVAQISQKRQTPETGIVLGSGKLEEASLAAQELGAECAVFDGELTGSQTVSYTHLRLYCRTRFSGSLNAESDARPCRVGGGTHYDVIPWWSNVYRLYESDVCRYVCIHGNFGG